MTQLRAAVAAGTLTQKLAEPLFGTTIKNPGLRYFVAVTAVDNYASIIAWGDMDPGFGNRSDILLAYDERNDDVAGSDYGSLANVGPRLIVPGDVKGGRHVSCVRDVRVASMDDSNGIVTGPTGPAGPAGATGAAGRPAGAEGRQRRGRARRQGDVQEAAAGRRCAARSSTPTKRPS